MQCLHILDLIAVLNELDSPTSKYTNLPHFLIGDFNTYKDYEIPMGLLNNSTLQCRNTSLNEHEFYYSQRKYDDVWKILHPDEAGLTFSNMVVLIFYSKLGFLTYFFFIAFSRHGK